MAEVRSLLAEARTATGALLDTDPEQPSFASLKELVTRLSDAVLHSLDEAEQANTRLAIELHCVRAAMHEELVDREANAARIQDRQRLLFDRANAQEGQLSAHDRAALSANYVEAALGALCPQPAGPAAGCHVAADAATR